MTETPKAICANCKHKGDGVGIDPPAEPGHIRRGPLIGPICLRHRTGTTSVDPVTGMGGEPIAPYCADINDGNCPDFEPARDDLGPAFFMVGLIAAGGTLILYFMSAAGVFQ